MAMLSPIWRHGNTEPLACCQCNVEIPENARYLQLEVNCTADEHTCSRQCMEALILRDGPQSRVGSSVPTVDQDGVCGFGISYNPDDSMFYLTNGDETVATFAKWADAVRYALNN